MRHPGIHILVCLAVIARFELALSLILILVSLVLIVGHSANFWMFLGDLLLSKCCWYALIWDTTKTTDEYFRLVLPATLVFQSPCIHADPQLVC